MKKILLIFIILFLTGCYDYMEINDLGFITAIGIDYEEDTYKATFEMLDDSDDIQKIKSESKTISNLFDNISLIISKVPDYHHLKTVIISKSVAQNHLKELTDFLIRSPEIRNEFLLVVCEGTSPLELFKKDSKKSIGEKIAKLIKTSKNQTNISYDRSFEDILEKLLNKKMEATASVITLENDEITLKGIGLFKGYNYKYFLDTKKSSLLNILNKENTNYSIFIENMETKIYESNVKYDFKENSVTININAKAKIIENTTQMDLKDNKNYLIIEKKLNKVLENDLNDLINNLKDNNIDSINLNDRQYKKTRKNRNNYLKNADIKINIDTKINWKGSIFQIDEN